MSLDKQTKKKNHKQAKLREISQEPGKRNFNFSDRKIAIFNVTKAR